MKCGLVLVMACACSSPKPAQPDGAGAGDDAAMDGHIGDAPADAAPMFTPSCTSGPTVFYDATPRLIGNIARAGTTLYVAASQVENGAPTDPVVVPIDLTTGVAGTPFVPGGAVSLWPGDGTVIANEATADGAIWRFDGGITPIQIVAHRAMPSAATEAGGYVYWGEGDGTVRRQLATGGPIEPLFACGSQIRDLVVAGSQLFCVAGAAITRGDAAGGGTPVPIGGTDAYPILTMVGDGTMLYFINLSPLPELWQLPVASDLATLADRGTTQGAYLGLALDGPTLYEISDSVGLIKMARATFASYPIVPSTRLAFDPVVANDQLYFVNPDARSVMHCVD